MKSIKIFILFLIISLNTSAQKAFDDSAKVFLNEVNKLRSNPKAFKSFLILYASNKAEFNPGVKVSGFITNDSTGFLALREAISFLDTVRPLGSLKYSEDIYKAIGDHKGIDTVTGIVKHDDDLFLRISKYNNTFKTTGENIALVSKTGQIGSKKKTTEISMKEALALFVIDITMYNQKKFRGSHRYAIFNPSYKFTAVKLVKVKCKTYLFQEFGG